MCNFLITDAWPWKEIPAFSPDNNCLFHYFSDLRSVPSNFLIDVHLGNTRHLGSWSITSKIDHGLLEIWGGTVGSVAEADILMTGEFGCRLVYMDKSRTMIKSVEIKIDTKADNAVALTQP